MDLKEAIAHLVEGRDLNEAQAEEVMERIMSGQATPAQIGGFLIALRTKGETVDEVTGFARTMRRNAIPIHSRQALLVDTCGTGGDGAHTFNISTTAALLDLSPEQVADCVDEVGIGFLYAPLLHPAMKHAIGPRREMGVRTVFNILGPLTNPAGAQVQVLGVYDEALTEMLARVLDSLGSRAAFVVHGADGLDEFSTTGPNKVSHLRSGQIRNFVLDPAELGLPRARLVDLRARDTEQNAAIVRAVLDGERGPRRDVVLLNAAAALTVAGLAAGFEEGLMLASQSIDGGAAGKTLAAMVAFTNNDGSR